MTLPQCLSLNKYCLLKMSLVVSLVVNASDSSIAQSKAINQAGHDTLALPTNSAANAIAASLREDFHMCGDDWRTGLTCADASVNLFSAWALTIERCKSADGSLNVRRSRREVDRAMASFVGYVHGKLRVIPPKWWQNAVEGASVDVGNEKTSEGHATVDLSFPFAPAQLVSASPGILASPRLNVAVDRDSVIIRQGLLSVSCSRSFLAAVEDEQGIPGDIVLAMEPLDDESVIVIAYSMLPMDVCGVACITTATNEVRWEKQFQLMPDMGGGYTGTGPWHRVSMSVDMNRVFLFQASGFGISISVVDPKDGNRIVVFFSDDICIE